MGVAVTEAYIKALADEAVSAAEQNAEGLEVLILKRLLSRYHSNPESFLKSLTLAHQKALTLSKSKLIPES